MTYEEALRLASRARSAIQQLENDAADRGDEDAEDNYAAAFGHLCDAIDCIKLQEPIQPEKEPQTA